MVGIHGSSVAPYVPLCAPHTGHSPHVLQCGACNPESRQTEDGKIRAITDAPLLALTTSAGVILLWGVHNLWALGCRKTVINIPTAYLDVITMLETAYMEMEHWFRSTGQHQAAEEQRIKKKKKSDAGDQEVQSGIQTAPARHPSLPARQPSSQLACPCSRQPASQSTFLPKLSSAVHVSIAGSCLNQGSELKRPRAGLGVRFPKSTFCVIFRNKY